jgi:hypothetical protein
MAGVFFSVGESLGDLRNLVGDGNALVAQLLEALEIIGMLADLLSLVSRNVAVELFAFMKPLQIKIGTLCNGFIALFLGKNLLAESAAPEAINRLEFSDESFSLCGELFNGVWHGAVISN